MIDVLGGHAHMAVATIVSARAHLRTGKLKGLATGGAKRVEVLPDLPTVAEAGLPGYEASIWWAWATAAHTPQAVLDRLNREVAAILNNPDTIKRFATDAAEVEIRTPRDIRDMLKSEMAKWDKVARDAGMQKQ